MRTHPSSTSSLPGLESAAVEALLSQMADLVLFLSPMQDIIALRAWGSVAEVVCPDWVGRSFASIISRDSQPKLAALFAEDAARADDSLRWRHVNLLCDVGPPLPVLLKYFELGEDHERVPVIVGRDLRPTVDMQARLQRAYTEMEAAFESRTTLQGTPTGALVVGGMIESIGQRPLGQIVSETARALEQLCIAEALRRCDDNPEAAARLLGLPPDEVRRRARVQ